MYSNIDRRGFLKAMLVLAGSMVAPSLISTRPHEPIYIPKIKQVIPYTNLPTYHNGRIYVATSGDDLRGNGTFGNPYNTITKALSEVKQYGVIHVASGIYQTGVRM